jgi:hypothetical protein
MDISDHLDTGFIKVGHLASGPRQVVIAEVRSGNYGPDCEFQDGSVLTLNKTNIRALNDAWGRETDNWIGKLVELYIGQTEFQGQKRDSVLVRTISPATPKDQLPPAKPKAERRAEMDDEIPF